MIRKIIDKVQSGLIREIISETKWIYSYALNYRKGIAAYILLGILATLLGLSGNVASKYLIDVVTGRSSDLIGQAIALYAGFGFAKIVMTAVTQRISAHLNVQSSNEIRAHVFSQFLNIDWQASLEYHSGDLLTRINSDVSTVSGSILGLIPNLITHTVQFVGALVIILIYDPVMALIALISAPITVLLSRFLIAKIRSSGEQLRQAQAELTSFCEEALQNLQAIKAFSLNETFNGRLAQLQELYRDISLRHNLFSVKTQSFFSIIGFFVSSFCFAWGAYQLWSERITFGTMILFIQMANTLSAAFSQLVSLVPSAISATVSARRIMTILDLPKDDLTVTAEAAAVLDHAPTYGVGVRMNDLSFSYTNGRDVFENLTLHADPGEIIGIVSPSGGGKTSLIRSMLGLIAPATGTITLTSGEHTAPMTPCMRSLITYVAQEKVVFSGTIAESLRMTNPQATDSEIEQALRLSCAWDFVSKLSGGIYCPLKERGAGLSEGQIQRLAIARALLSRAPIMLLDEATSALDMATERIVLRNLLSSGHRRTVILTTHRPTALLSCNRVYAIENGRVRLLNEQEVRALTSAEK